MGDAATSSAHRAVSRDATPPSDVIEPARPQGSNHSLPTSHSKVLSLQTASPPSSVPSSRDSAHSPSEPSRLASRQAAGKKKNKSSLLSFLTTKEPSLAALEQYAIQQHKNGTAVYPAVSVKTKKAAPIPQVLSSQKLPDNVPKVNSKWDGLPKVAHTKDHGALQSWRSNSASASKLGSRSGFHSTQRSVNSSKVVSAVPTGRTSPVSSGRASRDKTSSRPSSRPSSKPNVSREKPVEQSQSDQHGFAMLTASTPSAPLSPPPRSPKRIRQPPVFTNGPFPLASPPVSSPTTASPVGRPSLGIAVPSFLSETAPVAVREPVDDEALEFLTTPDLPEFPQSLKTRRVVHDVPTPPKSPVLPSPTIPPLTSQVEQRNKPVSSAAGFSSWPLAAPAISTSKNTLLVPAKSPDGSSTPSPELSPILAEFPKPATAIPVPKPKSKDRVSVPRNFARPFSPSSESSSKAAPSPTAAKRVAVPAKIRAKTKARGSDKYSTKHHALLEPAAQDLRPVARVKPSALPGRVVTTDSTLPTIPESDGASVISLKLSSIHEAEKYEQSTAAENAAEPSKASQTGFA